MTTLQILLAASSAISLIARALCRGGSLVDKRDDREIRRLRELEEV